MIGLIRLDEDLGLVEVAATNAPDDLGEEFEGALFGGEIGESKAGIGLDNTDGSEVRKVKAASEGLSADEDVDVAIFNRFVETGEIFVFIIIAVETSNFGIREELGEFGFEKFGTEALMNDVSVLAAGAARGDFLLMTTEVTVEGVSISVEGHREITIRAEGLPAAFFAESERSGATAVVKNERLLMGVEIVFDIV